MIRKLNIYVNPSKGTIVNQEGDGFFYLGDNNKIIIIPDEDVERISISGNTPGAGSYISELQKQEDGSFILENEDMNGFLTKTGKINCNIHISNENNERITTLPFQVESRIAFDREGTIITPGTAHTLEEVFDLLDRIENGELPGGGGGTGQNGKDGEDGFSPVITVVPIEGGYNLIITNKDMPDDIVTIYNGIDGKDGENGQDGVDGKDGEKGEKGDAGEPGKDGKDGVTPVRGTDYWTQEDIQIMKNECHVYIESLILGGAS